ncbi:hypothetical protein C0J52_14377 [Blattella germanica]|nr:hypothetical protein C0J52_14377 [Blattella germanica]
MLMVTFSGCYCFPSDAKATPNSSRCATQTKRKQISRQLYYVAQTATFLLVQFAVVYLFLVGSVFGRPYDPEDQKLPSVLPPDGMFEAFYPREVDNVPNGSSRPAHGHGSFFQHRNPALVDAKNAAAYGYRFDGGRRFNYD